MVQTNPSTASPDQTVQEVCVRCTLNTKQVLAFSTVALHALHPNRPVPLRLYIGDPGGTGKSRVIEALRFFYEFIKQERRFRLFAITGVAAYNIDAYTLHSALALYLYKDSKRSRTAADMLRAM